MDVCLRADKTMRANSAAADFAFIYLYMCAERLSASFHLSHAAKCDETNSITRSHWVGKRRRCKRENQLCHCWRHVTNSLIRARRAALLLRWRPSPRAFCGGNYARGDRMWRWKRRTEHISQSSTIFQQSAAPSPRVNHFTAHDFCVRFYCRLCECNTVIIHRTRFEKLMLTPIWTQRSISKDILTQHVHIEKSKFCDFLVRALLAAGVLANLRLQLRIPL